MNRSSQDHCTRVARGGRFVVIAAAALLSRGGAAQPAIETPAPSLKARVEQRVGITDVSIDYSSPGVKGRKIWGEVVPYDKVWRGGGNRATPPTGGTGP